MNRNYNRCLITTNDFNYWDEIDLAQTEPVGLKPLGSFTLCQTHRFLMEEGIKYFVQLTGYSRYSQSIPAHAGGHTGWLIEKLPTLSIILLHCKSLK